MEKLYRKNKLFFLLAFIVIGTRLIFAWLDMSFILGRVVDDAFYYFKTAQNIIKEHTSTFDGINRTNGYHPLWMACILPIFYLTNGNSYMSIHLVMTLQVIILALIIFFLWKILDREFGAPFPLIALTFFLWPRFLSQTEYGLEAGLLIFLLLFSINYCLTHKILTSQGNLKDNLLFGIIIGLILLARLDSVFYLISIASFLFYNILSGKFDTTTQNKTKILFKKFLIIFIPASIIALPYLLWNYFSFGHITPISGSLKHSFPKLSFTFEHFIEFKEFSTIFIFAILYFILIFLKLKSLNSLIPNKDYQAVLVISALYVTLHFLDTLFYMKWAVFRWHFAGYIVFIVLVIPLIINVAKKILNDFFGHRFVDKIKYISITILITVSFLSQFISIKRSIENRFQYEGYKEALWIKDNTSQNDIFMLEDAGIISYFSERRIINIDGVINNFEFQKYLEEGSFLQYIKKNNIKYFIHHAFWDNPDVRSGNYDKYLFKSYSHLYDVFGGTLTLNKSDEIYRSKEYNHFGRKTIFAIWKIKNTVY